MTVVATQRKLTSDNAASLRPRRRGGLSRDVVNVHAVQGDGTLPRMAMPRTVSAD